MQLLTQREQVRELIKRNLMERAREFNIIMDDVALTDLRFGRDFTAAVEAKQVAQQESERFVLYLLQNRRILFYLPFIYLLTCLCSPCACATLCAALLHICTGRGSLCRKLNR